MEIEITKPIFKCESDEEIFFQRLSEITGFQQIRIDNLALKLKVYNAENTLKEVRSICDLWHTSFEIIASKK